MTEVTRNDLLVDPVFRVRDATGARSSVSLARALALLSRGEGIEFLALQRHQEHAWHAFLVQIAAMVLHRAGTSAPHEDETTWREGLRELAGSSEAWHLVVPDLSRPAFMQPPVPEGSLRTFSMEAFPDDLDVLVTAKNHDVKRSRFARADAEHWALLLVSVQTSQGFSGRGNYGVARMNGGFGNRPMVAYASALDRASRFRRDVRACLEGRALAVDRRGFADLGGVALTWTQPWDGSSSIALDRLDPWFVESCRRIRLQRIGDGVVAWRKATDRPRIHAPEGGDTADPWTPVDRTKGTALTTAAAGFGYDRTQQLIFGGQFEMGAAGTIRSDDGRAPWFLAAALARGQGKTEGLHERTLQVSAPVASLLRVTRERNRLGERSKRWVEAAKTAKLKVLGPALSQLLGDGEATKKSRGRFLSAMDVAIDRAFFERLWGAAEIGEAAADELWSRDLVALARSQLAQAIASVPMRAADRFAAVARAEGLLEGCARKRFPGAFDATGRGST